MYHPHGAATTSTARLLQLGPIALAGLTIVLVAMIQIHTMIQTDAGGYGKLLESSASFLQATSNPLGWVTFIVVVAQAIAMWWYNIYTQCKRIELQDKRIREDMIINEIKQIDHKWAHTFFQCKIVNVPGESPKQLDENQMLEFLENLGTTTKMDQSMFIASGELHDLLIRCSVFF